MAWLNCRFLVMILFLFASRTIWELNGRLKARTYHWVHFKFGAGIKNGQRASHWRKPANQSYFELASASHTGAVESYATAPPATHRSVRHGKDLFT